MHLPDRHHDYKHRDTALKGPRCCDSVHMLGGRLFDPDHASNHISPHLHIPCAHVLGHVTSRALV